MDRPSRALIHMKTAILWSERSTCKRPDSKIGCVITNSEMTKILSIGYNGPPRKLHNDSCSNEQGKCGCIHAEMNAIAMCDSTLKDKIIFVTKSPCRVCASLIIQADITYVFFNDYYRDSQGLDLLYEAGIKTTRLEIPSE